MSDAPASTSHSATLYSVCQEDSMTDEDIKSAMVIPRWFVWFSGIVSSIFVIMFIPWATWVTNTLITISVQAQVANKIELKVETLAVKMQEHIADPNLHQAAVRDFERRIGRLESRLDSMETKK